MSDRLVRLTEPQIAFVRMSLDYGVSAMRDYDYDPQVQAWARAHASETEEKVRHAEETAAAIRRALAEEHG